MIPWQNFKPWPAKHCVRPLIHQAMEKLMLGSFTWICLYTAIFMYVNFIKLDACVIVIHLCTLRKLTDTVYMQSNKKYKLEESAQMLHVHVAPVFKAFATCTVYFMYECPCYSQWDHASWLQAHVTPRIFVELLRHFGGMQYYSWVEREHKQRPWPHKPRSLSQEWHGLAIRPTSHHLSYRNKFYEDECITFKFQLTISTN